MYLTEYAEIGVFVSQGTPLTKCPGEGALPHLGLPEKVYFVTCSKQGLEMEDVGLRRLGL